MDLAHEKSCDFPSSACEPDDTEADAPALFLTKAQTGRRAASVDRTEAVQAEIVLYEKGCLIEVNVKHEGRKQSQEGGGRRRAMQGFSKRSVQAFRRKLGKVDATVEAIAVGLTFADNIPDGRRAKQMLKAVFKRLQVLWPNVALAFKLEGEKRRCAETEGHEVVPHFHCLIYNVPIHMLREELPQMWFEVTRSTDLAHLRRGVRIDKVRSFGKYVSYIGKHRGYDELGACGQRYGFWGWKHVPKARRVVHKLSEEQAEQAKKLLGEFARVPVTENGLRVFCNDPTVRQELNEL